MSTDDAGEAGYRVGVSAGEWPNRAGVRPNGSQVKRRYPVAYRCSLSRGARIGAGAARQRPLQMHAEDYCRHERRHHGVSQTAIKQRARPSAGPAEGASPLTPTMRTRSMTRTAEMELADAQARAANASAAVVPDEQPQIAQVQAAHDKAKLDLEYRDPRAYGRDHRECRQAPGGPDGRSRRDGQPRLQQRLSLFQFQREGRWLNGARQRGAIEADAYPGQKFEAHGEHLCWNRSEFSLLPAQNANGTAKVTQRPCLDRLHRHPVEANDAYRRRPRPFTRPEEVA